MVSNWSPRSHNGKFQAKAISISVSKEWCRWEARQRTRLTTVAGGRCTRALSIVSFHWPVAVEDKRRRKWIPRFCWFDWLDLRDVTFSHMTSASFPSLSELRTSHCVGRTSYWMPWPASTLTGVPRYINTLLHPPHAPSVSSLQQQPATYSSNHQIINTSTRLP